jgi:hypothetical protein
MTTIIIALGALGTALFAVGYFRGVQNALNSFRQPERDDLEVPQYGHWYSMGFATLASAVIIATVGITPAFVYAGPLLAILAAAANGLAFFLEEKIPAAEADGVVASRPIDAKIMASGKAA